MIRIADDVRTRQVAGFLGVLAAALALLLVTTEPASAEDTDISVEVTRAPVFTGPGETGRLDVVVRNTGDEDTTVGLVFPVPLAAQGVEVSGQSPDCDSDGTVVCDFTVEAGDDEEIFTEFEAPESFSGVVSQQSSVVVSNLDGDELDGTDNVARYTATLRGEPAAEPPSSPRPVEISGVVVDGADNTPLVGAAVRLVDSQGGRSEIRSGPAGVFIWRSPTGPGRPTGIVTLTATAPSHQTAAASVRIPPGGKVGNVRLALAPLPVNGPDTQGQPGTGQSDPRKRDSAGFDTVSVLLAGAIGLGGLVAIAAIAWMWRGLGPASRRDATDLPPAGHRRRLFGQNSPDSTGPEPSRVVGPTPTPDRSRTPATRV